MINFKVASMSITKDFISVSDICSFFDNLLGTIYFINNILKSTVLLGFMLIVAQLSLKKKNVAQLFRDLRK